MSKYWMCTFFVLWSSVAHAQYRFGHLDVSDGLSQNSVNDIFQDRHGFLWFATQDGLSRYDGYDFVNYSRETIPEVSGRFLWCLFEDPSGNIWAATSRGATRLDWRNNRSTHFFYDINKRDSYNNQIARVTLVGDSVWISPDGHGTYAIKHNDYQNEKEVEITKKSTCIYKEHDELRRFFYAELDTLGKNVQISDDHLIFNDSVIYYPENHLVNSFKGTFLYYKSGFFLGTTKGLLFFDLDKESFKSTCVSFPTNDLLIEKTTGLLWIATNQGISLFSLENWECIDRITAGVEDYHLSVNQVSALYQSRDGLVWLGTANGGLHTYNPFARQFQYLNKETGISSKPVWSVLEVDNGMLVGSETGLFHVRERNESTLGSFKKVTLDQVEAIEQYPLTGKRVTALLNIGESKVLAGTTEGDLAIYDLTSRLVKSFTQLPEKQVISALVQRNDTIWVATHYKLFKVSDKLEILGVNEYDEDSSRYPTNYYLSAFKSRDETLWFGTNTGFSIYSMDRSLKNILYNENQLLISPIHYFISGFYEDPDGKIWMSTFGGGVSCFDRNTNSFFHLSTKEGLSNNVCASIQGWGDRIYVSANGGLNVINRKTLEVDIYTSEEGLLSEEFAIASSHRGDKDLFFGVANGLVFFSPESLVPQIIGPPSLTSVDINYETQPFIRLKENQLDLSPKDQIFTLSFSSMSRFKKDNTEYEYRMIGFQNDWVRTTSSNRRATYSLKPGKYQFELRSRTGNAMSSTTTLNVQKYPAFYQTTWFLIVSILGSMTVIVLASRYFSHQSLKRRLQELETQRKIQAERERISRDLHDNVGSQITYIATSIDNMNTASTQEIKELGEYTRDTMKQLRETIWVINKDTVTAEELKIKIVEFLSEILRPFPSIHHDIQIRSQSISIPPTKAMNLLRIIQEAVNNTLKHANASTIRISLTEDSLVVSDDGDGFEGIEKKGHFGLVNIKARAKELGAEMEIITALGEGTSIQVKPLRIGHIT